MKNLLWHQRLLKNLLWGCLWACAAVAVVWVGGFPSPM